jgi:hypothetical protein
LSSPALDIRRPFHWGIVTFCDDRDLEPWPDLVRGESFAASEICVVALVRHAQDIETDLSDLNPNDPLPFAEVNVRVWVDDAPSVGGFQFDGVLRINSGTLNVGDADRWDAMELPPGPWRLRVRTSPVNHASQLLAYLTAPSA